MQKLKVDVSDSYWTLNISNLKYNPTMNANYLKLQFNYVFYAAKVKLVN